MNFTGTLSLVVGSIISSSHKGGIFLGTRFSKINFSKVDPIGPKFGIETNTRTRSSNLKSDLTDDVIMSHFGVTFVQIKCEKLFLPLLITYF